MVQDLKKKPTIADFQKWAVRMREGRGFENESIIEECLLLGEEVGELFKAIRKHKTNITFDNKNSTTSEVEHELADVLIMLICVANSAGVDLEKAFRDKEVINNTRKWN